MSVLIDIHKVGERIYTMSSAGVLLAWFVNDDGTLEEMDIEVALHHEENNE